MAEPFRMEHRFRAPTPEEEEDLRSRGDVWRAELARRERGQANGLLVPFVVAAGALLFGVARDNLAVMLVGGAATAALAGLLGRALQKAGQRIEEAKGPWDPPEDGWQVRETVVVARSAVGAVTGDEDYAFWLLFEVPGGDWFFVDPASLQRDAAELAREELRIVCLWPRGGYLSASASGDSIPRRGATGMSGDYAADLDRGYEWRPEPAQLRGRDDGAVAESALPAWVHDAEAVETGPR